MTATRAPGRVRAVLALASASALAAGCGSGGQNPAASASPVRIGLLLTLTGNDNTIGQDVRDGFNLYLSQHDGKLGGHSIEVSLEDEGHTPDSARAGAQLLLNDHATAIVGPISSPDFQGVVDLTSAAKVPVVAVTERPTLRDIDYVWNVGFMGGDAGDAVGPYVYQHVGSPAYAISSDQPGSWEQIKGFMDSYAQAGGKLANSGGTPTTTPAGDNDFAKYFDQIKESGAKVVYCFYTGQQAVEFVKAYAESDVHDIPLYAPGYLTEGAQLTSEGDAAENITTVMDYSPDIDTASNRAFVSAWSASHAGEQPTVFAMTGFDAAALLDQAIAKSGAQPTSEQLNTAIGGLGRVDSPRGAWQMAATTHAPVQKWYLRRVQQDGSALANVEIEELATLGG